ncbi:MAG: restriction endonuclease subunit S [Candidatus Atribacteria bacterium]|nr:restriction endonuclease subunit S [Candidatus Atribacteria bacterium]
MKTQKVTLSSVAKIIMGTSPKGNTYNATGNGLPLLNGPTEFGDDHPDCTIYTTKSSKNCETGDLIFCVRGSTTGRMNWADQKYSLGRGVCSIRGKTQTDTLFIRYCIEHSLNRLLQFASGATFPNLTKDRIFSFKISYPNDRECIVDIIKKYDTLANINRRRIQLLEESARLLFREWFVYFRFPGHEKVKIVDGVPEGWKKEKINRLVTFKRGVEPGSNNYLETYESGSFPFFRVSDLVTRNPSIFVDEQYAKSALLEKSDIVISLDGSVGIVSMGLEGCYSTGIRKLIIKDKKINRSYLYFLMKSHYIQGVINAYAKGTTIQHAGEAIKHLNPILPPQNLMDLFDGIANPALNEILILLDQNQKLAQARDLLLPRLMSGEIEVSESNIEISKEVET